MTILIIWNFINPLGENFISVTLFDWDIEIVFNISFSQKIQIMYFKWNKPIFSEPIKNEFYIRAFFYLLWVNLVQKNKIVCLKWNSEHRIFRICWIWLGFSFFLFYTGSTLSGQIWSKQSKWPVSPEIWYII